MDKVKEAMLHIGDCNPYRFFFPVMLKIIIVITVIRIIGDIIIDNI